MALITPRTFDAVFGLQEAEICNLALARGAQEVMRDHEEDSKQARLARAIYAVTRDELLRIYQFSFARKTAFVHEDEDFVQPKDAWEYAYWKLDELRFDGTTALGSAVITAIPEVDLLPSDEYIGRIIFGTGVPNGARIVSILDQTITLDRVATAAGTVEMLMYLPMLRLLSSGADRFATRQIVDGHILSNAISDLASTRSTPTLHTIVHIPNRLEVQYTEQVINPSEFDPLFIDALVLRMAQKMAPPSSTNRSLGRDLAAEFSSIMREAMLASSRETIIEEPEPLWTDR
jgi:hypothetical protein